MPFVFQLLGCAILGVGIWVRVDTNFKEYVDNSEAFNYLYACAYILIAIGVVVMIVGFLGCCGSIRESQCMLATVSADSKYKGIPVFSHHVRTGHKNDLPRIFLCFFFSFYT